MWDILKHLLSKSKIRGWLICEIGLYVSMVYILEGEGHG